MADPATMAGAAVAMKMIGGVMEASDQSSALKASARVDRENARRTELQGEYQVLQTIREERATSGEAIAAMAGSGFALGTGSAADLIRQNAIEREVEIANIRYQASGEAANLRTNAADKKKAAKSVMIGGVINAIGEGAAGVSAINQQGILDRQRTKERESLLPVRASGIVAGDGMGVEPIPVQQMLTPTGIFGAMRYGRRRLSPGVY